MARNLVNKYKADKRIWKNFTRKQKEVFNFVMENSVGNQEMINAHPSEINTQLHPESWHTVCYNMACYAAWGLKREMNKVYIPTEDELPMDVD